MDIDERLGRMEGKLDNIEKTLEKQTVILETLGKLLGKLTAREFVRDMPEALELVPGLKPDRLTERVTALEEKVEGIRGALSK
jgi:hypothetical protein